jgi:hypothetical protein
VAVIDLDVAGHRADGRVFLEGGHQMPQGLGFDDAVRIHGHQDLPPGCAETRGQGLLFPPVVREADGVDEVGIAALGFVDVAPGVVGGAVVHADDFQPVGGIIGPGHGIEGHFHHAALVVGRDDHGEAGQGFGAQGGRPVAGPERGAQTLEKQQHQGVARAQRGEHRGIGATFQQLQVNPEGAPGEAQCQKD